MADSSRAGRRLRAAKGEPTSRARDNDYQRLDFGQRNWTIFGSGVACVILGFFLLSRGSLSAAPLLLVLGYLVLIPWSIASSSRNTNAR